MATSASTTFILKEEDVVKLTCEFLQNREMHISQVTLERESGIINGSFSDDMLFLRQLILDGQWDDILEFIQPLTSLDTFNYSAFRYIILKAKYIELLCIKNEAAFPSPESAVETVVDVLNEIEKVAPSKDEYSNLCLLLTLSKLSEHVEYKAWNPSKGRNSCFKEIRNLVEDLLGGPERKKNSGAASNDRLLQLIIKGILYESCVDYCQSKATNASENKNMEFTNLLSSSDFSDSDLSLLSWLQSIPEETFNCPFEQRSLNVNVERIKAPALETNWTEHMLITPIKPDIFPHSAMPTSRPKGAEIMTKSLNPNQNCKNEFKGQFDMSKSLASFHLTGKKMMETSVDVLFNASEDESSHKTQESKDKEKTPLVSEYHKSKKCGFQNNVIHHYESSSSSSRITSSHPSSSTPPTPRFTNVVTIEDTQAIRCAEFHPSGKCFAVGSNSKTLRLVAYQNTQSASPSILYNRTKHHKGSIYCCAWNPSGSLLATGSNDKTVKVLRFNEDSNSLEDSDVELLSHDGTVRDLTFLEDGSKESVHLISGGAGDCKIYVTDCRVFSTLTALSGHTSHVLSLYSWGNSLFVSGSADKTVRFWDSRRGCVNMVQFETSSVASVAVDPSGRLLVSGHEDSSVNLYDIRGCRIVQSFRPHTADVRSLSFSPNAYYLLSGAYDTRVALTDLQGDLTAPLPSVIVAQHSDKVISGRWHPTDFSFVSTSADKTCCLWVLPPLTLN